MNQKFVVYYKWVSNQSKVPPGFWLMPKGKLIKKAGGLLWLFSETDYQITNEISIDEEIRIWGNVRLYEGIAYDNSKYLILLNIMTSNVGYAKTLHAIQNIFEIKKFYEKQGLVYKYSQFSLTVNNDAATRMCEHLEKPNPRKLFRRKAVKNSFGYIDGEREVRIVKTNYAMG